MNREYDLPKKRPDESNVEWCDRAARAIPPESLLRELIDFLKHTERKDPNYSSSHRVWGLPAWSFIGSITNHGSGVSAAIANLYDPDRNSLVPDAMVALRDKAIDDHRAGLTEPMEHDWMGD